MVYGPTCLIRLASTYFLFIYLTLAQQEAEGNGEEWDGAGKKAGERFVLTLQLRLAQEESIELGKSFSSSGQPP